MAHDALEAHARDELGLSDKLTALRYRPRFRRPRHLQWARSFLFSRLFCHRKRGLFPSFAVRRLFVLPAWAQSQDVLRVRRRGSALHEWRSGVFWRWQPLQLERCLERRWRDGTTVEPKLLDMLRRPETNTFQFSTF
jgi:hypothetical protein